MNFYNVKGGYADYLKGKGLLFLGAGEFGELDGVTAADPLHVITVEALEKRCVALRERLLKHGNVQVINACISNATNVDELFNVCDPMDASSLLEPSQEHLKYFPNTKVADKITVVTTTVDDLLKKLGIAEEHCNVIFMSLQGSELFALQGMDKLLRSGHVQLIATDLIEPQFYKGGSTADEIEEALAEYGFHIAEQWQQGSMPIYEGVFLRKKEEAEYCHKEAVAYDDNALEDYLVSMSG